MTLKGRASACLSFLLSFFSASSVSAQSISKEPLASHKLGYSGATVAIKESNRRGPEADRTFILVGADGKTRTLPLNKGGGKIENARLSLFLADEDKYLVLSERDCVEFDPVKVTARYCLTRPPCDHGALKGPRYLGAFDWMNGFDPPRGRFQLRFRYLPAEDATENGTCRTTSTTRPG